MKIKLMITAAACGLAITGCTTYIPPAPPATTSYNYSPESSGWECHNGTWANPHTGQIYTTLPDGTFVQGVYDPTTYNYVMHDTNGLTYTGNMITGHAVVTNGRQRLEVRGLPYPDINYQ
jgi:hypothetical protein